MSPTGPPPATPRSPNSPQSVTVILPVYNQADHIAGLVTSYLAALERVAMDVELLLVPNGCRDESERICAELARDNERVRSVPLERGGWGRAVLAGIREARAELICYTNSARTTADVLVLVLLYSTVHPGVVVKANRRVRDSLIRRTGSLLYNLECRALFDLSVWDVNGTPKVFPRTCAGLLGLRREDDLVDAEFNAVCHRAGYPVIEVPILDTTRHSGRSTTNWRSALSLYLGAFRLRRELDRSDL